MPGAQSIEDVSMASAVVADTPPTVDISDSSSAPNVTGTYTWEASVSSQVLAEQSGHKSAIHRHTLASGKRIDMYYEFGGDFGAPKDLIGSWILRDPSLSPKQVREETELVKIVMKSSESLKLYYGKAKRYSMVVSCKRQLLKGSWFDIPDFVARKKARAAKTNARGPMLPPPNLQSKGSRSQASQSVPVPSSSRVISHHPPPIPSTSTGSQARRHSYDIPTNKGAATGKESKGNGTSSQAAPSLPPSRPPNRKSASTQQEKVKSDEALIVEALLPILRAIISGFGLEGEVIDCQEYFIGTRDGGYLKPDIVIKRTDHPGFSNSRDTDPIPDTEVTWRDCYMPIEVKTEIGRKVALDLKALEDELQISEKGSIGSIGSSLGSKSDQDIAELATAPLAAPSPNPSSTGSPKPYVNLPGSHVVFQMATYVREIFAVQPHRRWVPSLLFTETSVELFIWDRAGVLYSERLDYHKHPARMIILICRLLQKQTDGSPSALAGFDPTIGYTMIFPHMARRRDSVPSVEVFQIKFGGKDYRINQTLVNSYTIRSQGTTYYRATLADNPNEEFIIQDTWLDLGDWRSRFPQEDLHAVIENVRGRRRIQGLLEFHRMELVQTDGRVDCIHNNRREVGTVEDNVPNLVHCRMLLRHVGGHWAPFDSFIRPLELASVLRDIVIVCRKLYNLQTLVHRNITPWTILLHKPVKGSGYQGYLVDFTKSIELWRDNSSTENRAMHSYTRKENRLFKSINVIKNRKPSPLDDIESIYYILCFITTSYNGPISAKYAVDTIPTLIKGWMSKVRILALDAKLNHFRQPRTMRIQLYYKDLHPLVNELYHILKKRYDKAYRNMEFSIDEQLDAVQACFDRVLTPTSEIASNIGDEGGDHGGGEKRDAPTEDDKSAASERKRRRLNEQGEYEITEEVAKKDEC
ncbi:hypothetical protein M422DRAFT_36832 [Sphaerobolus stellatus SS14]|uniref:Fungal-type protein kinase domain-containing protein n=1 Tax=Sphaerobolus stellatus (strain SS14) TaxID=990650 RepID=A0A0C9U697_SPHS4|nr:hypothetical protein M422DRAFT_36832 [Sphaerobolus stellatus SS14]